MQIEKQKKESGSIPALVIDKRCKYENKKKKSHEKSKYRFFEKSAAQVSRENGIHPSMLSKWKREYKENPGTAFSGNGNISKPEAKLAESERLIGQLYAENAFLKSKEVLNRKVS